MVTEDERYQRAKARVRKIRSFYNNVITFVLVNILLMVINLIFSPRDLWFYWVTAIWGVVLLIQGINTFTIREQFLGDAWEEKKIDEYLEKEKQRSRKHKD